MTSWEQKLNSVVKAISKASGYNNYVDSNAKIVLRAIKGLQIESDEKNEGAGYRIVVNMSSAHVPTFCKQSSYKNAYELEASPRVGHKPAKVSNKRRVVDAALRELTGCKPESLYFAAVELNGSGISFYGDCCLTLRDDAVKKVLPAKSAKVLDRNSYDLIRSPLREEIEATAGGAEAARATKAESLSGDFTNDLPFIAAIKVLESRPGAGRLLSTGIVSNGVLEDEDYIETLMTKSFASGDVDEVRLSAADVALDERIRSRGLSGLPPAHAELLWRRRRRVSEGRLSEKRIPVRVVTTTGRTRG
jgi:hypothetical protein